ncbi:hypothetical protein MMC14_007203 [Varicellaria rhodocarpa]|nr:hypothetical protein [Varicellaria rhodocarpa]
MADLKAKDAAAKQRIINHMNADHQISLVRYLEHFCHLSSFSARNAKLQDISFKSLTILSSKNAQHVISIEPPMVAWVEARERVVAMDAEAVKGLKRSNITMKRYEEPSGFMALVFVAVAMTFALFSKRSNFESGSFLYNHVLRYAPGFAKWCYKIQPLLIFLMVTIHGSEVVYMGIGRLKKHSVPRFGILWWKWVLSTFIEGVGAFVRFDRIIKEEEEEEKKMKAKH